MGPISRDRLLLGSQCMPGWGGFIANPGDGWVCLGFARNPGS
ncbi:hypothetical protein SLEP1_g8711 [Rubroshorea leprosula]|uniref:Uncharacterized protein n=1 Tax=Rubroshorea leprosula TaxID=152421 RepID=A0AAV5I869_9ROSI|nr:hypothetical protein SLEP1_g8711 [Rubroshorea leprosula]